MLSDIGQSLLTSLTSRPWRYEDSTGYLCYDPTDIYLKCVGESLILLVDDTDCSRVLTPDDNAALVPVVRELVAKSRGEYDAAIIEKVRQALGLKEGSEVMYDQAGKKVVV